MKIEILSKKSDEIFDALVNGVRQFNAEVMGDEVSKPLSAIARDDNGEVVGGVSGRTIYQHFLIEVVWVAQAQRGAGLGRRLMEHAEAEARQRGCVAAQVDTLSFQGPAFYHKLGFEVVGRVPGFPRGHERLFLLKHFG